MALAPEQMLSIIGCEGLPESNGLLPAVWLLSRRTSFMSLVLVIGEGKAEMGLLTFASSPTQRHWIGDLGAVLKSFCYGSQAAGVTVFHAFFGRPEIGI